MSEMNLQCSCLWHKFQQFSGNKLRRNSLIMNQCHLSAFKLPRFINTRCFGNLDEGMSCCCFYTCAKFRKMRVERFQWMEYWNGLDAGCWTARLLLLYLFRNQKDESAMVSTDRMEFVVSL